MGKIQAFLPPQYFHLSFYWKWLSSYKINLKIIFSHLKYKLIFIFIGINCQTMQNLLKKEGYWITNL